MTIYTFVDVFKQRYKNKLSNNYLKHYTSLKNHLQEFEKESGFKVSFETINKEFYLLFTDYLSSKGKKINTIGANIRRLKRLMNEAVEDNLTGNLGHRSRNFKVLNEEVDMIYLSEKELDEYYKMELDNDRYRYIRDLFVLHCHTGLRHSDWSKLSLENIRDGNLFLRTQKTKEYVIIPMHPIVLDVLKKYEGKTVIPTNQEVNRVLKYIGEYARVNKISEGTNVKWTQITTHTARRSFATNAYLAGIPMLAIMKITGHKKTETFLRYIRVTKLENAMKLKDHPFFNR